jgi:membrane-associated phospholipid phosphatase
MHGSPAEKRLLALLLASLLAAPGLGGIGSARAQEPETEKPLNGSVLLRLGIETAVVGFASFGLHPRTQDVPPSGLDPATIKLTWDRDAVQIPNLSSYTASDVFVWGSMLYPAAISLLAPGGEGAGSARERGLVMETESLLLAMGTTAILKVAVSRPRPYTYLPEDERPPDNVKYDVTQDRAFASFPSGHTSNAFAAATSGVAFLALERPDLGWGTQMANGAVAGGMAMATGLLRVDAVQHFPTDVLVGSLIGVAAGTAAAFLDGQAVGNSDDTRNALLAGVAGFGVGIGLAFLFSPPTSPWVN